MANKISSCISTSALTLLLCLALLGGCAASEPDMPSDDRLISVKYDPDTDYDVYTFHAAAENGRFLFGVGGIHIATYPLILYKHKTTKVFVLSSVNSTEYLNDGAAEDLMLGYHRFDVKPDFSFNTQYCEYRMTAGIDGELVNRYRNNWAYLDNELSRYALADLRDKQGHIIARSSCKPHHPKANLAGYYY